MTKRKGSLRLDRDAWFLRVYIAGRQRSFHLGHRRDSVSKDEVHAAADTAGGNHQDGDFSLDAFHLARHPISAIRLCRTEDLFDNRSSPPTEAMVLGHKGRRCDEIAWSLNSGTLKLEGNSEAGTKPPESNMPRPALAELRLHRRWAKLHSALAHSTDRTDGCSVGQPRN